MEKEFVPYDKVLRMKALGFDEPCLGYWSNWGIQEPFLLTCELGTEKESCAIRRKNFLCSAPTFSQAFRWFREKYQLIGYPYPNEYQKYGYRLTEVKVPENEELFYDWGTKDAYEEAELDCLTKLIEIVEAEKK